jgi:hypothetical protein
MTFEQQLAAAAFYRRKDKRFVEKLWDLVENSDLDDVIRWGKDGTYIVIPNTTTFEERVLKVYFKTKVYSSFVRQLHMYGFRKRTQEVELTAAGASNFEHKMFVRGKFDQLRSLPFMGRNQRVFQRPTTTLATQPAHSLTTRFNYPAVTVPGLLATQLHNRSDAQPVLQSVITSLSSPQDDDKENCAIKPTPKLAPLLVLAEICSAILSKGHPENEEQRRQCIQFAIESIQGGYRRDPFLQDRRFNLKPSGAVTTSINSMVPLPLHFIHPTTEVKFAQLICPQQTPPRSINKQVVKDRLVPITQGKPSAMTTSTVTPPSSTMLDEDNPSEEVPLVIDID